MANKIYPKFKEFILAFMLTSTIKVQLVDTGNYTYSDAHGNLSDIPSNARVGTAYTLTSKTQVNGLFDAADAAFGATSGASVEALVIYNDTPATEATKTLILYLDVVTGLPVTPNGGPINVTFDAAGILQI